MITPGCCQGVRTEEFSSTKLEEMTLPIGTAYTIERYVCRKDEVDSQPQSARVIKSAQDIDQRT